MHGYIGLRGTIFGFNGVSYKAKLAKGKTFMVFMIVHSTTNAFSRIYGCVNWLYKYTKHATENVFPRMTNFLSNHWSFLLKSFALYGITNHKILFLKDHFFMKINLQWIATLISMNFIFEWQIFTLLFT